MLSFEYVQSFAKLHLLNMAQHDQAKRILVIMQHAVKEDYSKELQEAQVTYQKIQNLRQLYKLL